MYQPKSFIRGSQQSTSQSLKRTYVYFFHNHLEECYAYSILELKSHCWQKDVFYEGPPLIAMVISSRHI